MSVSLEQSHQWIFLCPFFLLLQRNHVRYEFGDFTQNNIRACAALCLPAWYFFFSFFCSVCNCENGMLDVSSCSGVEHAQCDWTMSSADGRKGGGETPLITQINKHADELPQWNNGNTTTGSVTSAADTEHNYSSFLPLCLLNIRFFISSYGSLDIFVFYCSYSVFFSLFLLQWFFCFFPLCLWPCLSETFVVSYL